MKKFIVNSKIKICVIGLGYVGLPLAIAFGKKFLTVGYDNNKNRVHELKKNNDENFQVDKKQFKRSKKLIFSDDILHAKKCNTYILTLPTPVNKKNLPDLTLLKLGIYKIIPIIKKGDVIIIESTVYPGVTEDVCGKLIETKTKYKLNKDFFLGYSPERINPGDKKKKLENINKIISGSNLKTLKFLDYLYSMIIKAKIVKVNSIKVAEAAKVIENTQRDINIALINELSMLFNKLKIDTHEVLKAASSKWNFHSYEPGLVGGHCIGVDPYYLTYIAKKNNFKANVILSGRKINDELPNYIFKSLLKISKEKKIDPSQSKLLFIGLTFKENCNDFRNSKSLDLLQLISKRYKFTKIYDPFINNKNIKYFKNFDYLNLNNIKKNKFDIIIISVPHKKTLDFLKKNIHKLLNKKSIIFDIKNKLNLKKINIDFKL